MQRWTNFILLTVMLLCMGCEWRLKPNDEKSEEVQVTVERYDRIESLYLTTGDYAALQQMNTEYPMQTRMLIEDVLHIGKADAPDINARFLKFYEDSVLQSLLVDVQQQYADIDDLNEDLSMAFRRMKERIPSLMIPQIYAQIGSFDQSITVGNGILGISLDKYLGEDYPFYREHYSQEQRSMMVRSMIVPDCLGFYLLSIFPMAQNHELTQQERDIHMGKIQWVVNWALRRSVFNNEYVRAVDKYMKNHQGQTTEQMLHNNDYRSFWQ